MFQNISNINQFTNNKKMNMLWSLKKDGLFLPPSPSIIASSNKEQNISSITNKLMSGKRLTPEEMRYLREHAPDTYRQAVEANAERSAYESAAKSCRSKEDVQNLHAQSMSGILASAKADPTGAQIKAAAVADAHITFVQSNAYSKLPTASEQNQSNDNNDGKSKKSNINRTKERQDLMQEMMDVKQKMQFTLRNYHAQAEKQANTEASSKGESKVEPVRKPTNNEEAAVFSRVQSSTDSYKAYLQSKGITIEDPMENHVSFASLLNNSSSLNPRNDISSATVDSATVDSATVGRAHVAYVTARSTVTSTSTSASTTNAVKSRLQAKA